MNQHPPKGLAEVVRFYGNPWNYVSLEDGTLSPQWERHHITRVDLPAPLKLDLSPCADEGSVSRITCNVKIANILEEVMEIIYEKGLWEGLGGYSGGFVWRPQRGSRKISMHAFGAAWDFGATRDPLGDAPGGPDPDMPLEIVRVFEGYGFTWGGRWQRPDQMHFQYGDI